MAVHRFVCDKCGFVIEDTTAKGIHLCKNGHGGMRWDCRGVYIRGNYTRPVHSDALAVPEHQRKEHEAMFPNIRLDEQCRPIFSNYTDHEAYLKKCNIIKQPQKIRPKGKRIAEIKSAKATGG